MQLGLSLAINRWNSFSNIQRIMMISPAVAGKTIWDLNKDGPLNLSSQGTWVITPLTTFVVDTKAWGEGGDYNQNGGSGLGGGGAFAGGLVTLVANTSYTLGIGQGRGPKPLYGPVGGGWTGILRTLTLAAVLMAGGGGGGGYELGVNGGPGGWPNGFNGMADGPDSPGIGATQLGPGAGGISTGALYPTNGGPGSGQTGGLGGYAGGSGGGGYYGGGGGAGSDYSGASGGGGSSYFDPASVTSEKMLNGSGTIPGNASDPDRNGAGSALSGRLILATPTITVGQFTFNTSVQSGHLLTSGLL